MGLTTGRNLVGYLLCIGFNRGIIPVSFTDTEEKAEEYHKALIRANVMPNHVVYTLYAPQGTGPDGKWPMANLLVRFGPDGPEAWRCLCGKDGCTSKWHDFSDGTGNLSELVTFAQSRPETDAKNYRVPDETSEDDASVVEGDSESGFSQDSGVSDADVRRLMSTLGISVN